MSQDQADSTASAAEELKNRGNAFFKAGKVTEASKCYAKAEELDPANPLYSSNLSASLFEEGDYLSCVMAIHRWCHLDGSKSLKQNNPGLGLRLSTRLAKALSHGVRCGSVSQSILQDIDVTIMEFELLSRAGEPDLQRLWTEWDRIADGAANREESTAAARARFATLPMFRNSVKPILEYFNIGQDALMSLIDDWGPDHQSPVNIQNMSDQDLSCLAFLFGGAGDARHVYSTLVGLHRAHKKLDKKRQTVFHAHITLIDVHPAALARDLCILILLDQLINTPAERSLAKAEILSTMFYTFAGAVMPGYCYVRLEKVMSDLKSSLAKGDGSVLPSWIHVDPAANLKLTAVLEFWASVKFSTRDTLLAHTPSSPASVLKLVKDPNISEEFRKGAEARIAVQRSEVTEMLTSMNSSQLRNMGLTPPSVNASAEEKRQFAIRRGNLIDSMLETSLNNCGNMNFERMWYEQVKIFVPLRELWSKHVGMELFPGMSRGSPPSPNTFTKIREHIDETWKPNLTLFDPANPRGLPNLDFDSFEAPGYIDICNHRFGINSTTDNDTPDAPALGNFIDLFEKVSEALSSLKNKFKLEVICGELTEELLKMRFGCDSTRPADFPRTYKRGHLSNVPDYTHGTLNTIIYVLPIVEEVSSNCFLNSGIWANDEEFIHTYTLLKSSDVPKYLGCRFLTLEAMQNLVILRKLDLPVPLTKLASRQELITWLTRTLLYTIVPSRSPPIQFRARLPHNLVAFMALLLHLQRVGFPGHWLSEFLQTVLSGSLVTDIAPYADKWPIPVSDITRRVPARAVRLDPWRTEFETILATSLHAIPFCVPLPADFASLHTDIGTFEATVQTSAFQMGTMLGNPPLEDPVVCLLLYKPVPGVSADALVGRLPQILNGARTPEPGTLCVLTAQEVVDPPVIRWKLSRARVARMREEGWAMVGYRTDTKLSSPVPADKWREV